MQILNSKENPQHIYGISQGVTNEILFSGGIGIVPLSKNKSAEHINYLSGIPFGFSPEDFLWKILLIKLRIFIIKRVNVTLLFFSAMGPLRLELCGMDDFPLRGEKKEKKLNIILKKLLRKVLQGFLTGLDYYPQTFSDTDELIELSKNFCF
ncbi:MAG: hypothetical protein Ct9H90mP2_01230 [Dehalococcoidia bacterium]|nr:MAG: hypothetical protein Ct9H90mP2_01230 [Dehalococcoidia bacterium]